MPCVYSWGKERVGLVETVALAYIYCCYCCCSLAAKSCPTVCGPVDCSLPGSSVHGISQARVLEWIAICSSRKSSQVRDQTPVSYLAGGFFTTEPPGKSLYIYTTMCKINSLAGSCRIAQGTRLGAL